MACKVVVAEDEKITLSNVIDALREEGYDVSGTSDGIEALQMIEKTHVDILITDIKMPRLSGIELLEKVKEGYPEIEVIVITGFGSISSAIESVKKGAYDYITKPFDLDELVLQVQKIRHEKLLRKENLALKSFLGLDKKISAVAESVAMKGILETVARTKDSHFNLLLMGETGVGKGLLAKIVHFTSARRDHPFLSVNCAVLTEDLLASELFGHERGAFTGALAAKQGLVEIADTGTLFLDEIAELTPALQAKLLKVVEEQEFYRVGGTKPIKVDVRFIAATNQNIREIISSGRFREDLYYRLNVIEIFIPPLRERKEDIRPLSEYFLGKHLPKSRKSIKGFTPEAMDALMNYGFPGNVRELENIIERAIILESGTLVTKDSLPQSIQLSVAGLQSASEERIRTADEVVRDYAKKVLQMVGGNRSRAAELLGMSRTSLWKILKED